MAQDPTADASPDTPAAPCEYDDAAFRPFHLKLSVATLSGVFSDGFELGLIGVALTSATPALGLSPLWVGLLGAASLAGLFFGALATGPFADRFGRRVVFRWNMAVIAVLALLQFFVTEPAQLLAIRLILGFLLGTDYVVSKALLMEFAPLRYRGRILGTLGVAWAAGYVSAYFVGFALHSDSPDAWRYILAAGAVPALLILPLRLTVPESPPWLVHHGRLAEARRVIDRHMGANVALPSARDAFTVGGSRLMELMSPQWRIRTLIGATFFTCQVIPYFALGTFVSRVMTALNASDTGLGGLVYNLFLLVGAVLGWGVVDHISRRSFLVGSFAISAGALGVLAGWPNPPAAAVVGLFAVVACTLSAASALCYVYLTELFPTHLRASGVGLSIAVSRIGSAVSTFLLPVVVAGFGIRVALGLCVATLVAGGLTCLFLAPETRHVRLSESFG